MGVVLAWGLDQVTKIWAVERLSGREPVEIIPGWLSFDFLRNPGAAFGLGSAWTVVLTLIAVVVVVVVVRLSTRLRDVPWAVALGLLLAGTLGNLTDRFFREPAPLKGHVVDFINYNGWFVGNVADIYLTVAAVLIILRSLQGVSIDGTREQQEERS